MSRDMLEQASKYDHWAWLYNRTLGPRYGAYKIGPIERVVLPHVPAGGAILDLCCGTGQLAAALAERGFNVTGLDGSADMLRHARENAPSVAFTEGDACNFTFDTPFDAVLCTSASLNHMQSVDDLVFVFSSVNRALTPGGIFVFDVNHPAQMSRYWRGHPTEGEINTDFAWLITPQYDSAANRGAFTVEIYRRPDAHPVSVLDRLFARLARFRRIRLALLSHFRRLRPQWEHHSVVNRIWGHDLDAMSRALHESGFSVELRSTQGGPVDDSHAAYFFCRKAPSAEKQAETAKETAL
ncbi:class I SAM-dependent methyltransferase [Agrobacterium vitis]|uniref:Methyltransferase domain-containing protein n=2 Tax=Agrobacterium vitis TaxID=373 RepID=A0AAE5AX96_AGRVI|nr:class I SAM-dependent methyltransferase [Allorhizobium sp. Av2]MCM2442439.1 class I SAM-dependent methyltransferase [Agrobacterium vitis]MUZ60233.1 methyltransferase domain-containing protein [Agrobacterium vitis]MVA67666.1 methyltransferase domain-containing protein [Agrobacterium vitis]MVA89871.1 methyltransferase domain-containing protein [Agrobacterium vitis]